jgi:hypothetical protein
MAKGRPDDKGGLTVTQLQKQIAAVEGFQVSFDRLGAAEAPVPPYAHDVMAPSKWRISDWKRVRLAPYIAIFKAVRVIRGDETVVTSDIKLVTLRDSYYEARHGTLEPEIPAPVTSLAEHRLAKQSGKAPDG